MFGVELLGVAPREASEADAAHQPVARDARWTQHLGDASAGEQARAHQLEQPVLCVDDALAEAGVHGRLREDVRHAVAVAHDLDTALDATHRNTTARGWDAASTGDPPGGL